jgi:hypothetical protein
MRKGKHTLEERLSRLSTGGFDFCRKALQSKQTKIHIHIHFRDTFDSRSRIIDVSNAKK